jgi:phosphohistidine phosphatase
MKTLYLVRHSKASADAESDFERTLTTEGKQIAQVMAKACVKEIDADDTLPRPTSLLVSPARRTFTTAFSFAKALDFESNKIETNDELFHATFERFWEIIEELDDAHQSIMIVAHNPSISQLANHLLDSYNIMFSPGTVCAIQLDIDTWKACSQGLGQERFYLAPEEVSRS